eukprot:TRINITY_DN2352_c0_g1_i22.p1 TRINITY_DN2352_c0_g1~~TRINITY_DN2352_c0_g1_i22.p1  ORF type:complete len:258 (-),score=17.66 TRINITY_DN2352_c0_g1_i22:53-826(-)
MGNVILQIRHDKCERLEFLTSQGTKTGYFIADPSMKKFDEEISKLKALNKLNVEIYARLDTRSPFCSSCRRAVVKGRCQYCYHSGCVCVAPVGEGQCTRCSLPIPSTWITDSVSYVQLHGTQLLVNVEPRTIAKPKFVSHFESINLFNDPLPNLGYNCMERVIVKYEMLHHQKALSLVQKWKKALEDIQVVLGELESQRQTSSEQIDVVLKLCQMNKESGNKNGSQYVRQLKSKYSNNNMQFHLQYPQQESLLPEMM